MENFIVESFSANQARPLKKDSFKTIDECNKWCDIERKDKSMWFEIHHSIGAVSYLEGIASAWSEEVTWFEKMYSKREMPSVKPWWRITELPAHWKK